jgi:putative ABC transport system permease protein
LSNLLAVEPGLRAANIATFHIPLPESRYQSTADAAAFFLNVQQRIETIPGVIGASGTGSLPFGPAFAVETPVVWFQIIGRETGDGERPPQGWQSTALPHYHETLGVPVLAGRGFTGADDANATRVVLVNEAMAHRYWSNESPVGATLRIGEDEWSVIGIVGNVRHGGLASDVEPMIHLPYGQHPTPGLGHALSYVVRTVGEPLQLLPELRQAVWSVDPDVPITRVSTMESLVAESGSDERYRTMVMMVFAITAVVVATGGVFSVTAQGVERQARELGIRMALGARAERLVGTVLKGSLVTAVVGTVSGLLVALWSTRVLSRFLFGVESSDPFTYGLVGALLIGVCVGASALPARRASRVDPIEVLRTE